MPVGLERPATHWPKYHWERIGPPPHQMKNYDFTCRSKRVNICDALLPLLTFYLIVSCEVANVYYNTLVFLVTVVTLSTGNAFLIINGHTFRKEDCGNGATSRWCCNEPTRGKCDVYAHVNEKYELVLIVNKHNHEPVLCRMLQGRII